MAKIKRPKFNLEQEDLRPQQSNTLNSALTGAAAGGMMGAYADSPTELAADVALGAAGGAVWDKASKILPKKIRPLGDAVNTASRYLANSPKLAGAVGVGSRFLGPVGVGLSAIELASNINQAYNDINANKANAFEGYGRALTSPIQGFFSYLNNPNAKGFSDYWGKVKDEYNVGINTANKANEAKSLEAQIAAEEAKRPKQTAAAPQGQTWEEQRAGLTQAMANSVKENPDNPYAWDVPPGFGTVVGSDGKPKYVVPDKPYDPDKAYEQEMRNRAYQYYMDAISLAGSPFATPERKAAELARANLLAQTFGLGVDLNAVAAGGGGGLRAGASNATLNKMIDLQLKGEENKKELIKEQQKAIMEQFPDDKDKGLRAQNNALAATDFSNVNPHSAEDMNRVRLENQINAELAAEMERVGATGGNIDGITKRTPGGGFGEAWNAIPFLPEWAYLDPDYYIQSHGKEYALNEKNLSKGARAKADEIANNALDNQSLNAQYNAYVREGGKLSFPNWLKQIKQGK